MPNAELTNTDIVDKFLSRIGVSFTAATAGWREVRGDYQSEWKCVFKRPGKQWTVRFHMGSAHKDPPTAYDVLTCVVSDWYTNENDDYDQLGFDEDEAKKVRKDTERQSRRFEEFFGRDMRILTEYVTDLDSDPTDARAAEARAALLGEEYNKPEMTRCLYCDAWINPKFGDDSPAEHAGAAGTEDDPRAPGDYDDICDVCNYERGLRGGPNFTPGIHVERE